MDNHLPYHPCTSILIQGLINLKAYHVLNEWDRARAIIDKQLLEKIKKDDDEYQKVSMRVLSDQQNQP